MKKPAVGSPRAYEHAVACYSLTKRRIASSQKQTPSLFLIELDEYLPFDQKRVVCRRSAMNRYDKNEIGVYIFGGSNDLQ